VSAYLLLSWQPPLRTTEWFSEAIEATELVVNDSCHGAAEPRMDLTRERCQARLRPLLQQGIVPS